MFDDYNATNEYKKKAYPYKLKVDVFVTNEYTSEGAWGHTEPARRVICIRSPEHLAYEFMDPAKGDMNEVLRHEICHNLYPNANESAVLKMGKNPFMNYKLKDVEIIYH